MHTCFSEKSLEATPAGQRQGQGRGRQLTPPRCIWHSNRQTLGQWWEGVVVCKGLSG